MAPVIREGQTFLLGKLSLSEFNVLSLFNDT